MPPRFDRLRRSFEARGFTTAALPPRAVEGRPDDYRLAPSRPVESDTLAWIDVGRPAACPEDLAFVDGIQHYEVVGYAAPLPILAAEIAAAVRLRTAGDYRTVERQVRRLLLGRTGVVERWADDPDFTTVGIDGDGILHPLEELERIRRAIDSARASLEREVAGRFRARFGGWLIVDGVISDTGIWKGDDRVIGLSKSHATLPFGGPELTRYLELPAGHRTTVFEPATWRVEPVYSWALRLWPWQGQDLLHGLVRIEISRSDEAIGRASEISRWILAERVPLSRPDHRWDRLIYGIAGVERHLRSLPDSPVAHPPFAVPQAR